MKNLDKTNNFDNISGSFRDPSGFLFSINNQLYRQVNNVYREHYDMLINSGLYDELSKEKLLITHQEIKPESLNINLNKELYKIIKPEKINFTSYPYEWCFSQLKDAALITLKIQKIALKYKMILKDASAYNIQFYKGKPIFIDTLSFEKYEEGTPWVAYRQFCQHFLAPLLLMSYKDIRLNQLLKVYIDGIPLDLASSLLPFKTRFSLSTLTHIHFHSKSQKHFEEKNVDGNKYKVSMNGLLGIIDSLETKIQKLTPKSDATEWGDYYNDTNYTDNSLEYKKTIVEEFIKKANPSSVWDLGANNGYFTRIASNNNIDSIAFDIDPIAVEKNYIQSKQNNETCILPLLMDLSNPSPGIGWAHDERNSFMKRGLADLVMSLALIHHITISNNISFNMFADFLSKICKYLIMEFVPKTDSQVSRLLRTRKDTFESYDKQNFEQSFSKYFDIIEKINVIKSERIIYLLKKI